MSKQPDKNNFVKQAGILATAGIICRIIGILYRRPLTSLLGLEGLGYYSMAYNIYTMILLISSYSIPSAISKEISRKLIIKDFKNAQRIFYAALIYVCIVGGLASLFTFFGANLLVEENSIIVLKVFAPTIFLSSLLGVLRGYFQAQSTMVPTSISQILEQIFNAVISISAAYFLMKSVSHADTTTQAIYGAAGSAVGTGCGVVLALLFMMLVYLKNKNRIYKQMQQCSNIQLQPYREIFRNIIFTVTPIILSTFIYNLSTSLNQTLYTKILIYFKGFQEEIVSIRYGVFSGEAIVIANIPIALASAMASSILPGISGAFALGDNKGAIQKTDVAIRYGMLISIPSAVGLFALAKPIVLILFPQKATIWQASALVACLSITVVFYSLSTITNAVLQGIGKVNIPVLNALISLIIQAIVLITLLFTTKLDLFILAIAAIVYSFFMCVLNGISLRKELSYQINLKKCFLIPFSAASIMGVLAYFLYNGLYFITKINVVSLFATIAIAAAIYLILLLHLGGIDKSELETLPFGKKIKAFTKNDGSE